jgi:hypothetical protein
LAPPGLGSAGLASEVSRRITDERLDISSTVYLGR